MIRRRPHLIIAKSVLRVIQFRIVKNWIYFKKFKFRKSVIVRRKFFKIQHKTPLSFYIKTAGSWPLFFAYTRNQTTNQYCTNLSSNMFEFASRNSKINENTLLRLVPSLLFRFRNFIVLNESSSQIPLLTITTLATSANFVNSKTFKILNSNFVIVRWVLLNVLLIKRVITQSIARLILK
jgi:hypothetical protein